LGETSDLRYFSPHVSVGPTRIRSSYQTRVQPFFPFHPLSTDLFIPSVALCFPLSLFFLLLLECFFCLTVNRHFFLLFAVLPLFLGPLFNFPPPLTFQSDFAKCYLDFLPLSFFIIISVFPPAGSLFFFPSVFYPHFFFFSLCFSVKTTNFYKHYHLYNYAPHSVVPLFFHVFPRCPTPPPFSPAYFPIASSKSFSHTPPFPTVQVHFLLEFFRSPAFFHIHTPGFPLCALTSAFSLVKTPATLICHSSLHFPCQSLLVFLLFSLDQHLPVVCSLPLGSPLAKRRPRVFLPAALHGPPCFFLAGFFQDSP